MRTKTTIPRFHQAIAGHLFLAGHTVLVTTTAFEATAADILSQAAGGTVVTLARGEWDSEKWTPLRLPHQKKLRTFVQRNESIGVEAFTDEERKNRLDNVLLMTDTGTTEGEFEVIFSLSGQSGSAPGIFLGPRIKDGVLDTSIALFVATYTMAVWKTQIDPESGETKYTHLVRVNRWTEPNRKHVLRCRYSRKQNSVVIRLDQSDPIMLRNTGVDMNSLIGIWACHGPCDFYSVKFTQKPILQWSASDPKKQQ